MSEAVPNQPVRHGKWTGMEGVVGLVLLSGVLLSVALIVAGLLWQWIATGHPATDHPVSGMNLAEYGAMELGEAVRGQWTPALLVNLGILCLILTPFARVLASMISFAVLERDWKYTLITAFVLGVLTYSLFVR
jgi:uncharacterized membrane protein